MKNALVLALALATTPLAATAGGPGYTYAELGWQQTDVDDIGEADGPAFNASVALGENVHLFGGYARQDAEERLFVPELDDTIDLRVDADLYRVGLGYNHSLGERVDLVLRGAYERQHFDVGVRGLDVRVDGKSDGWSAEAGVRGLLAERFEGWAAVGYADIGSINLEGESLGTDESEDDEVYGRLGAQFMWNANWGVVGEARVGDDVQQLFVGVRGTFDNWD